MDREIFVQNIKILCKSRGIFPTVACRESGVGNSFINDIERGKTPSVAKVQQLAQFLGVSTSELLGEIPCGTASLTTAPQEGDISQYEWQLLQAYRKADTRAKDMVKLALEPFGLSGVEEKVM